MTDVNRAIELKPKLGKAYEVRGILHRVAGRFAESAADYDRALVLTARGASRGWEYLGRALARLGTGAMQDAVADCQAACEQAAECAETDELGWYALACALALRARLARPGDDPAELRAQALAHLRHTIQAGELLPERVLADPDAAELTSDPSVRKFLAEAQGART